MVTEQSPSRYARRENIHTDAFQQIIADLNAISASGRYTLPDHTRINRERYPWAEGMLSSPEFYAARLWEYPWAILQANLKPGMTVADVGCGQTPFLIYLKEKAGCEVVGFDPEYLEPSGHYCHGVSAEFAEQTGIKFVNSGIEKIDYPDSSFDVVFCISVIEHVDNLHDQAAGMREVARILKPGGLAVFTVDVNLKMRVANPLYLIWESGLPLYEDRIDLAMPPERFGIFEDGKQPADVFGFVLRKPDGTIQTEYGESAQTDAAWRVGYWRDTYFWTMNITGYPKKFQRVNHDLMRDTTKGGYPSLKTLMRIGAKYLLRRYPKVED